MNEYLFSYGTLRNTEVQLKVFGRRLSGWSDCIVGYRTEAIEIEDEEFLSTGEGKTQLTTVFSGDIADTIGGMVFEVSHDELLEADKYEPESYERVRVTVGSGKEAWLYTAGKNS